MTTPSQQVREGAAWVAQNAKYIQIRHDRIADYAGMLLDKYKIIDALPHDCHFVSDASPEKTAAYLLALDSINFGSGYFHVAWREGVALEYENIARGLKAAFVAGCFDTPQKWCAVTADDCHKTFSIPKAAHPLLDELMRLFADHLQETGRQMMNLYGGSVRALLNDAGKSAVRFVSIVSQWPTFADMTRYHGRDIFVLKRAQILAADIHLAFGNSYFDDIADLTMFADNMVAHVLWCDGVLSYAPDLANRIASGEMIASGSDEETELRCVAIHAVELIKAATGGAVTSVNIDHILWNRGYEPEIYKIPTHRTLTTWY